MMENDLPVVVCIGTINVSGDALGPLVGDLLAERLCGMVHLYGTGKRPVNGVNLVEYMDYINAVHSGSLVIAVDASVGRKCDVGKVKVSGGGVNAGGALCKNLPKVGHIGVTGIVAERGSDNFSSLLGVPFERVEKLSLIAAKRVEELVALYYYKRVGAGKRAYGFYQNA